MATTGEWSWLSCSCWLQCNWDRFPEEICRLISRQHKEHLLDRKVALGDDWERKRNVRHWKVWRADSYGNSFDRALKMQTNKNRQKKPKNKNKTRKDRKRKKNRPWINLADVENYFLCKIHCKTTFAAVQNSAEAWNRAERSATDASSESRLFRWVSSSWELQCKTFLTCFVTVSKNAPKIRLWIRLKRRWNG